MEYVMIVSSDVCIDESLHAVVVLETILFVYSQDLKKWQLVAVGYFPFKCEPFWRGADMQSVFSWVEDIVPRTVVEIIWEKFEIKNRRWKAKFIKDDKRKNLQMVWLVLYIRR